MKKILIVFILFIALFSTEVKAANKYADVRWIPGVYYNYTYNNIQYWGQMAYIFMDGKLSYCVDISKNITTAPYVISDVSNISDEVILYGYFGYGYSNNIYFNDYLATQKLIWESFGIEVTFTTASGGMGSIINVDSNVANIKEYVDEYKKEISLESDFIFELGSTEKIKMNKLTNNFIIENNSTNDMAFLEDNVVFYPNEVGNFNFNLRENYLYRGENKLYLSNTSQTVLQIGNIANRTVTYNYSIRNGMLDIIIKSNETLNNNLGKATLKGNIFNLYTKDYIFIGTYESDESGKLLVENLIVGDYILEHLYVSEGYTKEKILYNFSVSSDNINPNIEVLIKPKTINLFIKKAYGNPIAGTYYLDDNVEFELYNSNGDIAGKITTDENGEAEIEITYDEYKLVQSNTNKVRDLLPEYTIYTSDFNGNNYFSFYTPVYDSKLKLYIYEIGSTIPIINSKVKIDGKDYITNYEGVIITDYLREGTNCIYQDVLDNYIANDEVCIDITENSNFYIENGGVYIDFTMYNEKKIIEEPIEEVTIEEKVENIIGISKEAKNNEEILINEENKIMYNAFIEELPNLYSYFFETTKGLYKC